MSFKTQFFAISERDICNLERALAVDLKHEIASLLQLFHKMHEAEICKIKSKRRARLENSKILSTRDARKSNFSASLILTPVRHFRQPDISDSARSSHQAGTSTSLIFPTELDVRARLAHQPSTSISPALTPGSREKAAACANP
jgi:hypothetical protein